MMQHEDYGDVDLHEYRQMRAAEMPERELQEQVRRLCKQLGHLFYHPHDSRHSAAGYPDCTIVTQDGRLIFVELKREGKQPTTAQREWLAALEAAGCEVYIWRPSDLLSGFVHDTLGAFS